METQNYFKTEHKNLTTNLHLAVPVIIILQTCQYYDNRICVRIMCELTLSF